MDSTSQCDKFELQYDGVIKSDPSLTSGIGNVFENLTTCKIFLRPVT